MVEGSASSFDHSNVTSGIRNTGTGQIVAGVTGIGVFYESAFTGGIVNAPFGLIEAGAYGIDVYDDSTFLGGINNSGTIRSVDFWHPR